jgi:hypothetical protein
MMALVPMLIALAAPAAPAAVTPDPWLGKQFLYYRAVAFRGMVAEKMCGGGAVGREFEALSARLEKARARLKKRSKTGFFEVKADKVERAVPCNDGDAAFTMLGYARAVADVELAAK